MVKQQRRLSGIDDLVISPSAKGLATREVAHRSEVYGIEASRHTISMILTRSWPAWPSGRTAHRTRSTWCGLSTRLL